MADWLLGESKAIHTLLIPRYRAGHFLPGCGKFGVITGNRGVDEQRWYIPETELFKIRLTMMA